MSPYRLTRGQHEVIDGEGRRVALRAGDLTDLSETAYRAFSDKFEPAEEPPEGPQEPEEGNPEGRDAPDAPGGPDGGADAASDAPTGDAGTPIDVSALTIHDVITAIEAGQITAPAALEQERARGEHARATLIARLEAITGDGSEG